MTVRVDPEANGTRALFGMADLEARHVLEIGCGDGRFTWSFADRAGHVTAIDPDAEQIALAREHLPAQLEDRVEFHDIGFEDFATAGPPAAFDVVILSWALC
jgi:2-polyprenyl-3-methyl-5-hydroxy-6-metoxy-1,4-benzoquinol methylase